MNYGSTVRKLDHTEFECPGPNDGIVLRKGKSPPEGRYLQRQSGELAGNSEVLCDEAAILIGEQQENRLEAGGDKPGRRRDEGFVAGLAEREELHRDIGRGSHDLRALEKRAPGNRRRAIQRTPTPGTRPG